MKLKEVIQDHVGCSLVWGKTDCITFFCKTQEALYNINTDIVWRDNYYDLKSAVKWAKKLAPSGDFWSKTFMIDYERFTVDYNTIQDGDGFVYTDRNLPHAMTYYNGFWWTITENGFTQLPVNRETVFEIWRKTCHQ